MNHRPAAIIALSAAATMLAALPATAQNALGDGTALDNNLNVEGTRNLPGAAPVYGARNLLVTNNVAAGRGFRAAVGYRASDDFRGATGSDDLFSFRAGSALSALDVVNLGRGWQSINVGQDMGIVAYHRSTTGATLASVREPRLLEAPLQYGQMLDAEARLDRALLSYQSNGRLLDSRPESLAYFTTEDGAVMQLTASSLRGLRVGPVNQDLNQIGLTEFDRARLLDQALTGGQLTIAPGTPFELDIRRLLDAQSQQASEGAPTINLPAAYQELMRSLATQTGGETPDEAAQRLNDQMLRTSQWLRGGEQPLAPQPPATDEPAEDAANQPFSVPGSAPTNPVAPGMPTGDAQNPAPQLPAGSPLAESDTHQPVKLPENTTLEMLRHGRIIDSLATEDDDRFSEILRQGEQRLREGDFFLAERQFVRALNFHPNHPLALAGLANTQLGAGVLASASVSLRSLFVNRPEMIDAQYAPGILPAEERLNEAVEALERRLESERRTSGAALVLAYIGRQRSDRAMMQRGIDFLQQIDPDDPLIPVLKVVWLSGGDDGEK